jgi:hypothetical protein
LHVKFPTKHHPSTKRVLFRCSLDHTTEIHRRWMDEFYSRWFFYENMSQGTVRFSLIPGQGVNVDCRDNKCSAIA